MEFAKLAIESIIHDIAELPGDWMDDKARALVEEIQSSVQRGSALRRGPTVGDLEVALKERRGFLDVCRLLLGVGQEPAGHLLCTKLGLTSMSWSALRRLGKQDPKRMATALAEVGLLHWPTSS